MIWNKVKAISCRPSMSPSRSAANHAAAAGIASRAIPGAGRSSLALPRRPGPDCSATRAAWRLPRRPGKPIAQMPCAARRHRCQIPAMRSGRPVRAAFPRFPSGRFKASKHAAAFALSLVRCRLLVTAFPSPATAACCQTTIPGSTFLACYFACLPSASTARSALKLRYLDRFAPTPAASPLQSPLLLPPQAPRPAAPASTPLRDFYIPLDQSVPLARRPAAFLPTTPDLLSLPAAPNYFTSMGQRIIVPGPLRFRRLAVPSDISSCSARPALCYRPLPAFPSSSCDARSDLA